MNIHNIKLVEISVGDCNYDRNVPNVMTAPWNPKYMHLMLVHRLALHQGFTGVVGATSGLLDAFAMMGINTLCIHHFKLTIIIRISFSNIRM